MGCTWDIYCVDCSDFADYDINHGDDELRQLIQVAPEIKALVDKVSTLEHIIDFEVLFHYRQPTQWLTYHVGHKLVICNEYGQKAPVELRPGDAAVGDGSV